MADAIIEGKALAAEESGEEAEGEAEGISEAAAEAANVSKEEVAEVKAEAKEEAAKEEVAKEAPKASEDKKGDDLTKIKGIGKAYQAKLNSEGVFTFDEVANMTDEQIATMEEKYSFKGDFKESVAHAKELVAAK